MRVDSGRLDGGGLKDGGLESGRLDGGRLEADTTAEDSMAVNSTVTQCEPREGLHSVLGNIFCTIYVVCPIINTTVITNYL